MNSLNKTSERAKELKGHLVFNGNELIPLDFVAFSFRSLCLFCRFVLLFDFCSPLPFTDNEKAMHKP